MYEVSFESVFFLFLITSVEQRVAQGKYKELIKYIKYKNTRTMPQRSELMLNKTLRFKNLILLITWNIINVLDNDKLARKIKYQSRKETHNSLSPEINPVDQSKD